MKTKAELEAEAQARRQDLANFVTATGSTDPAVAEAAQAQLSVKERRVAIADARVKLASS